jgi:hypothetical protein
MYHQILLYRLLDCINVVSNNKWVEDDLLEFMIKIAPAMLSWLKNLVFSTGFIPFLNDASGDIVPSSSQLFSYAERLNIEYADIPLKDSNYRVFKGDSYTFICDVGGISPAYQCGHSHADTFNFVLEVNGKPFFVDTGCSTYEIGETRMYERGTSAHNTVVVNSVHSSHVWASHRVGKRAQVKVLEDNPNKITAQHNGYKKVIHKRTYIKNADNIEIIDNIQSKIIDPRSTAFFHLDNSIRSITINENTVTILGINLIFQDFSNIYITEYDQAVSINKRIMAKCICVDFKQNLDTKIFFL